MNIVSSQFIIVYFIVMKKISEKINPGFAKKLNDIILAIPDTKENDILEKFAKDNKINYFRGSEEDVLSRYYGAAKKFKADIIVRITSDCPLIDPQIVDLVIEKHLNSKADYTSNKDSLKRFEIFKNTIKKHKFKYTNAFLGNLIKKHDRV